MAGAVTISSNTITGPSGTKQIGPLLVSGVGNVIEVTDLQFGGASTMLVTSPVGATGCVISPPASNLVSLTLKGGFTDTGINIQPNQAMLLTFENPTFANTFYVQSSGIVNGPVEVSFF